jgi:WhiB family transcriptional regulator, redox-sensing transcriptional regulator
MKNESFMIFAKCRTTADKIDFFPEPGTPNSNSAVKFCQDCPAKKACLQYSIENEIYHGVWGGVSQNKRQKMIKDYLKSNVSKRQNKWQHLAKV